LISIFASPKKFEGHIKTIQENAIKSWCRITPKAQIILFDHNSYSGKLAKENNIDYVPELKKNEKGTPYISDIFIQGQKLARHKLCCYINCDIIVPENFAQTADNIAKQAGRKFLVTGQRNDLNWNTSVDFENTEDIKALYKYAENNAILHSITGMDYFIFPKGMYKKIPDLLIGRAGFDNWLIWYARRIGAQVIDATESIFIIHQNHDYNHLKEGKKEAFEGSEARENIKQLGDGRTKALNILDTTWEYKEGTLIKKKSPEHINRQLGKLPAIYPEISGLMQLYKKMYRKFFLKKQ
jgi:hypothetical protein